MTRYLDFEIDIEKIEKKIKELNISKINYNDEKQKLLDQKIKTYQDWILLDTFIIMLQMAKSM